MERLVENICKKIIEENERDWKEWRGKIEKDLENAINEIKEIGMKIEGVSKSDEKRVGSTEKELKKIKKDIEKV